VRITLKEPGVSDVKVFKSYLRKSVLGRIVEDTYNVQNTIKRMKHSWRLSVVYSVKTTKSIVNSSMYVF